MHGKNNSGPAVKQWQDGARVIYAIKGPDYGQHGKVFRAGPREQRTHEQGWVWVKWDDGQAMYVDPNNLDRA